MKNAKNLIIICFVLPALILAVMLFCISTGSDDIGFFDALRALMGIGESDKIMIVKTLRLPRTLMAAVAGMGLAVSGCVFQGILKNPLADPFTLGISGGASFGAAVSFIFLGNAFWFVLPLFAFLGAVGAVFLVYTLSAKRRFDSGSVILSGVIVSYIFSSAVMLLFALASASRMQSAFVWLMGNFSSFDDRLIGVVSVSVIILSVLLCLCANIVNALSLGGEKSRTFGINTDMWIKIIFLIASFITAGIVSMCGVIGFVGLMMPHIMRKFVGANHNFLLPASALAGAVFLPFCDALSRTIFAPVMMPVGVVTNISGGIFFIFLLLRGKENA